MKIQRILRNPFVLIPITVGTALIIVALLAWQSLKFLDAPSGFNRKILSAPIRMISEIQKPDNVIDFAGNRLDTLFFRTTDPHKLYRLDANLRKASFVSLEFPLIKTSRYKYSCFVDSLNTYLLFGNFKQMIKVGNDGAVKAYNNMPSIFTRSAYISPNSFAIRSFDSLDQIFTKVDFNSGTIIKEKNVSPKVGDAGISTDGVLLFDQTSRLLTYVFYDKNEFLCLDTNLSLVKRVHTIDKGPSLTTKAELIKSSDVITSVTPKRGGNVSACVSEGMLYIISRVKGDNEEKDVSNKNNVIDVYNLRTGRNSFSFYIPDCHSEKLRMIRVIGNTLIAQYKSFIVAYDIARLLSNHKNDIP